MSATRGTKVRSLFGKTVILEELDTEGKVVTHRLYHSWRPPRPPAGRFECMYLELVIWPGALPGERGLPCRRDHHSAV